MNIQQVGKKIWTQVAAWMMLALLLAAAGCGGSSKSSTVTLPQGLPPAPSPGQTNSYVGSQGASAAASQAGGDVWSLTVDHPTNSYSGQDVTLGTPMASGLFVNQSGVLSMTQTNIAPAFQSYGFGLEVLGRALLFRPGMASFNTSIFPGPVVMAVPGTCPAINGTVTFQFVTLPNDLWSADSDAAFGSLSATSTGTAWTFSNYNLSTLASGPAAAETLGAGTCGTSVGGKVVSIPASATNPNSTTIAVGPSGFFVLNRGAGLPASVGVLAPASSLPASTIVAGKYLGVISEPNGPFDPNTGIQLASQVVSFAPSFSSVCAAPVSATAICGGAFGSDNVAASPNTDTVIDLGSEDGTVHGLFRNVTVTLPDPNDACATGLFQCSFPAVAVAGNPEGKVALFLIAQDPVNFSPMTIYLLQQ